MEILAPASELLASLQVIPCDPSARGGGTITKNRPPSSAHRYGFSRITGVFSITVYGRSGHAPSGGLITPTKTMFQFPPRHEPNSALRESHCCCDPEFTTPSIL